MGPEVLLLVLSLVAALAAVGVVVLWLRALQRAMSMLVKLTMFVLALLFFLASIGGVAAWWVLR